jgi:hypothetical protein
MILAILKAYKALTGTGGMDNAPTVLHLQHIQQSLTGFWLWRKSDIDMFIFSFLLHLLFKKLFFQRPLPAAINIASS